MGPGARQAFLESWHDIVRRRDTAAIGALLEADVTIGTPPYWQRLEGHALVHFLLGVILETIEDFTYHREYATGGELALEFTGHVGGIELQGIDLITLSEHGKVARLDVLIRPANAVEALRERVGPRMEAWLAEHAAS